MSETDAGAALVANQEPRHVGTCCFGRPAPAVECRIIREDGRDTIADEPGEFLVRRSG
jgi:hypothetical protein